MKNIGFAITIGIFCFIGGTSIAADVPLKSGIERSYFDDSVKPGQDFFQYVNGGWLKKNPIPPDQSSWGVDQVMHEQTLKWLRDIIESLANKTGVGPNEQKIHDLYATATDDAKLQMDGAAPLKDEFDAIAKAQTVDQLIDVIAHEHVDGLDVTFNFSINPDEKVSS